MSVVGVCFVFMFIVCEVLYFNSKRQKFKHSSKISVRPLLCHTLPYTVILGSLSYRLLYTILEYE